jgi:hypothetical protein
MAKGKKTCPSCSVVVGARTKVCSCGYVFIAPKESTEDNTVVSAIEEHDDLKEKVGFH